MLRETQGRVYLASRLWSFRVFEIQESSLELSTVKLCQMQNPSSSQEKHLLCSIKMEQFKGGHITGCAILINPMEYHRGVRVTSKEQALQATCLDKQLGLDSCSWLQGVLKLNMFFPYQTLIKITFRPRKQEYRKP